MGGYTFQKATVKRAKARVAIIGPAGAGKTYGALIIADGIVGESGRKALIDTERGRSVNHADIFNFDILELENHSPDSYVEAMRAAFSHVGPDGCVIVDSSTHEWFATLSRVETKSSQGGNKYTSWNGASQEHERFVRELVSSPCHLITTIRSDMSYELVDDEKGKKTPKRVGMAPTQRKGIEFELDIIVSVDQDHMASLAKCNAASLSKILEALLYRERKLTAAFGQAIKKWIDAGGNPAEAQAVKPEDESVSVKPTVGPLERIESLRFRLETLEDKADTPPELFKEINAEGLARLGSQASVVKALTDLGLVKGGKKPTEAMLGFLDIIESRPRAESYG